MDESKEMLNRQEVEESISQTKIVAKRRNKKKIKATIYLTEEAELAFTELYIHRLRKDRKTDRSLIACDAIQALYEKECTQS
jgi:predicted ATP-dependent serine protease